MTTLVRLPNWLGDTVLALPALEGLVATGDSLIVAGRAIPLEITAHLAPAARRLHLQWKGAAGLSAWGAARAVRAQRVDRAVLLTPSLSSALCVWWAGVRERIGWAEQGRAPLLTHRLERAPRGALHLCEEFKALARAVGAETFPAVPVLPPDPVAGREAETFLRRLGGSAGGDGRAVRLALCPGVNYGWAKQWPAERFRKVRRLAEERGWGGLIVGSAVERALAEQILEGAGPGWSVAAGAGSLRFAAELMRRCDAAVCNDTGTMHLAAAVGTPVAAVFGPSEPAWTGPLGLRHTVLRGDCACAPCFRRTCGEGRPAPCMLAVDAQTVVHALEGLMSASQGAGDVG